MGQGSGPSGPTGPKGPTLTVIRGGGTTGPIWGGSSDAGFVLVDGSGSPSSSTSTAADLTNLLSDPAFYDPASTKGPGSFAVPPGAIGPLTLDDGSAINCTYCGTPFDSDVAVYPTGPGRAFMQGEQDPGCPNPRCPSNHRRNAPMTVVHGREDDDPPEDSGTFVATDPPDDEG
jgi:hypothetical protein